MKSIIGYLTGLSKKNISIYEHYQQIERLQLEVRRFFTKNINGENTDIFGLTVYINKLTDNSFSRDDNLPEVGAIGSNVIRVFDNCVRNESSAWLDLLFMNTLEFYASEEFPFGKKQEFESYVASLMDGASWTETDDSLRKAQILSQACHYGLSNKIIDVDFGVQIVKKLLSTLHRGRLFNRGKIMCGTSFLLRSLVICNKFGDDAYISEFSNKLQETVLRRVEIKKETIFAYVNNSSVTFSHALEQIRWSQYLLEVCVFRNDFRFLNAALKSNDRLGSVLRSIKISTKMDIPNLYNTLLSLYYIYIINAQERIYNNMQEKIYSGIGFHV